MPRNLFKYLVALSLVSASSLAVAEYPFIAREQGIVIPVMGSRLSSKFGLRVHPIKKFSAKHSGVDLAAPTRAHVFAIKSGLVVFAGTYAGYGKLVTIDHGNKRVSMYGHLSEIAVNPGQRIIAGQVLGRVGSTGHSTGPHLHLEWRVDGQPLDPLKVFPELVSAPKG